MDLNNNDYSSFYEYIIGCGYCFDYKLIENYLLSIKSNPFVLLCGVSGCGKSTLPILFSNYLSTKEKKEDIILKSTNSLGKSFSNKEWHLKRKVISEILPVLPFEGKECFFTVNDSFSSVGKFTLDPRFKFNDKRLINHLIKLHQEDPNQDVDLKIKVGESIVDASYLKINDFEHEFDLFNKFDDDINNGVESNIYKFLKNSRKDKNKKHFIIIENIEKEYEKSLINFFDYLRCEFNLFEYNNLFVICTVNIDDFDVNFSNSFLDQVSIIEMNNLNVSEYLSTSFSKFPEFGDINYLEFDSDDLFNLSIPEFKSIFQEIWCNGHDLWTLISKEIMILEDIFAKEGLTITFRTINDILRFLVVSWRYDGKNYNWENWEKYFDIQVKQKLLPKIKNKPIYSNFFNDLTKFCFKSSEGNISIENIKYPCSYLKIKNMEVSSELTSFSFFNLYNKFNDLEEIQELDVNIKKKGKKSSQDNVSKYGSYIYKSGDQFTINKQINRKHKNFGKFDTLEDATFIRNLLNDKEWVLSRIKNNDCIYEKDDEFWIIKVFRNKLHILGKFLSYNEANDHIEWLTDEFKNNENFSTYISKPDISKDLIDVNEIIDGITGWEKIIFDAINEIESNVFSVNELKSLDIFKMYQFEDESLESIIVENLNKLANLKLIRILGNNYYKKVF